MQIGDFKTIMDSGAALIGFFAFLYLVFTIGKQMLGVLERLVAAVENLGQKNDQILARLGVIELRLQKEDE